MKKIILLSIVTVLISSGCALNPFSSEEKNNSSQSDAKVNPILQTEDSNGKETTSDSSNKLYLSGKGINKIPEYVFEQTNLEELYISNNKIGGAIQAEIRHLANLKRLDMSDNLMTGVPAEIGQLSKLEILDLSNNQLTGLPNELGNLSNLKTLDISGNNYSELDLGQIEKKLPATVDIIK